MTWLLILILGTATQPMIVSIPGFAREAQCADAAVRVADRVPQMLGDFIEFFHVLLQLVFHMGKLVLEPVILVLFVNHPFNMGKILFSNF